jgi:uncharacterized protein (DUF433 family)
MSSLERITITADVRFGKPCIRGTRITVGDILGYPAGGMSEDQIPADFPQLTREECAISFQIPCTFVYSARAAQVTRYWQLAQPQMEPTRDGFTSRRP